MTEHPHIGGGGGATQVLRAVAPFAARRTAIIAVALSRAEADTLAG